MTDSITVTVFLGFFFFLVTSEIVFASLYPGITFVHGHVSESIRHNETVSWYHMCMNTSESLEADCSSLLTHKYVLFSCNEHATSREGIPAVTD